MPVVHRLLSEYWEHGSPRKYPRKTDRGQSLGIGKGLGKGDIADIFHDIDFPTRRPGHAL